MLKILVYLLLNLYTARLNATIDNSEQLKKSFDENIVNAPVSYLEGSNRHMIAYKKVSYPKSNKSLVFIHGTGENMQRYTHVARYFYAEGFNIYMYDQRGHGYSGRFTDSSVKIHTDSFERQVEDLSFMVNLAVDGLKDNQVYLVGHSMGGLIALRYLELFPNTISKAAVIAPMLKMQTPFPETLSYYLTKGACYFGKCEQWAPGQHPDNVKDATFLDLRETHNEKLHNAYVSAIEEDPKNRKTWGVTYGWVQKAMDLEYVTRDKAEIKKIETEFIMLTPSDDYFVDIEEQTVFCDTSTKCKQTVYDGSWHGLLQEQDFYRNKAFEEIRDFFYK